MRQSMPSGMVVKQLAITILLQQIYPGCGADIVAVCDADPDKAATTATRFRIAKTYSDAAAMLEQKRLRRGGGRWPV
ncbi:putative dehydrogenase [Bradyrhizobium sp. LM2.7]